MRRHRIAPWVVTAIALTSACAMSGGPRVAPPTGELPPKGTAARIAWLQQAVAADPRDVAAWTELGNEYFDTNQPGPAIAAYDRSLALKPGAPNVLCDQASMYRQLGDYVRAEANLKRAIAMEPGHLNCKHNLGVIYFELRRFEEGMWLLQQVMARGDGMQAARARAVIEELQTRP